MSEAQIRDYAKEKGFHPQTLERWLGWDERDREGLFRVAYTLKIGENHLRDLMDWLEEVALREPPGIHEILSRPDIHRIETDPRLGRADKLKRIKEQIRRLRFPRLVETEHAIRVRIQALGLHPAIRLSVPAGLEGGNLHVEFNAASPDELKKMSGKLADAADKAQVKEIFGFLIGQSVANDGKASP